MESEIATRKSGIEGDDHATHFCRAVHEGLPLLPQARPEFQDNLASCRHDTPITGYPATIPKE
jgi:hypothetical protein